MSTYEWKMWIRHPCLSKALQRFLVELLFQIDEFSWFGTELIRGRFMQYSHTEQKVTARTPARGRLISLKPPMRPGLPLGRTL